MPAVKTTPRAELAILARYDFIRELAGHDYGSGQRGAELMRRRRELGGREGTYAYGHVRLADVGEVPAAELVEAFDRLGGARIRRLTREHWRHGTHSTRRSLKSWRKVESEVLRLRVASPV